MLFELVGGHDPTGEERVDLRLEVKGQRVQELRGQDGEGRGARVVGARRGVGEVA